MAKPEGAGRPSNEELYNKEPEIDEGCEQAIAAVEAQYPGCKILEASAKKEGETVTGYEVTAGYIEGESIYHIVECELDASCTITSTEERPDEAPGQAKKPKVEHH